MIYRLIKVTVQIFSHIPYSLGQFLGKMLGTAVSLIPLHKLENTNGRLDGLSGQPGNLVQTMGFLRRLCDRYNVAYRNIENCFRKVRGEKEIYRIYRGLLVQFGRMIFEVPHILNLNAGNLERYVDFVNPENLETALKKGKGALLLTGHFGNWEMIPAAISLRFTRVAALARRVDYEPLERFISETRARYGLEIIEKQRAMRQILNALKRNRGIGILLDQNVDWYEGVFVKFFGEWACTNKGPAAIARKTGTPVVPVFPIKNPSGGYSLFFEPEIALVRTDDKRRDIEENTALFTAVIEKYIRRYPDQWFWFHKRWKTRPYCSIEAP